MKCATLQQDIADPNQMISHRNTFSALVLKIGMTSVISMSRFSRQFCQSDDAIVSQPQFMQVKKCWFNDGFDSFTKC